MGRSPTCEPHRHDQTSPNMQIHSHTPHQLPNASNVQIATFCHNLEAVCIGRVQLTSNQHLQSQRLQTARCPQPTRACSLASGLGYPQAACTSRSTCLHRSSSHRHPVAPGLLFLLELILLLGLFRSSCCDLFGPAMRPSDHLDPRKRWARD